MAFIRWTTCPKVISEKSDILISCKGTIGETVINNIGEIHIARQFMAIRSLSNVILSDYFYLAIKAVIEEIRNSARGIIPGISREDILFRKIGIPPLNEQIRIVKEQKRLFHIIDALEVSSKEISNTLSQVKSKILELAICGKLVPQDPADEPAEELLRRINPSAVPADKSHYELPANWAMAKGKDLFLPMKSTTPKGSTFKYIDIDSIDNINQCISAIKVLPVEKAPSRANRYTEKNNVLFSMVRPYLRNIALVTEDNCIASTGFYVCRPRECLEHKYLYYLMISSYVVDGLNKFMKGDNSPSINKGHIDHFDFPLPPLDEQKRIVAKIDELFNVIDKIQQSLEA